MKSLAKQFSAYFAVAGIGYFVDFGLLILLHEVFGVHYLVAAATGFIGGLAVLYALSSRYVFKNSKLSSKSTEVGLFALIGIVGLGILSLSMWLLTDLVGINYLVSKIIATVGVYLWNFFARRALYHN